MNQEDLKKFVLENPALVKVRETSNPDLFVLKYDRKVFYNSLWNEYLEECRGTVIDKEFNVISRPFTKIYNYGIEDKAPKLSLDTPVYAHRKINGFMVAVTLYKGELLVSTTGSIDSDFVGMAKEFIDEELFKKVISEYNRSINYTFMFECVHRNDPHIITEKEGLYLLGYRRNSWDSVVRADTYMMDELVYKFRCMRPQVYFWELNYLLELVKTVDHEGFVFYTKDGISAKIKSPFYLVSKFIARTNSKLHMIFGKDYKNFIDEEFYGLCEMLQAKYTVEEFKAIPEQDRLIIIREWAANV